MFLSFYAPCFASCCTCSCSVVCVLRPAFLVLCSAVVYCSLFCDLRSAFAFCVLGSAFCLPCSSFFVSCLGSAIFLLGSHYHRVPSLFFSACLSCSLCVQLVSSPLVLTLCALRIASSNTSNVLATRLRSSVFCTHRFGTVLDGSTSPARLPACLLSF